MSILQIVTVPDRRLTQKSIAVLDVTDETRKLMDDMLETMYHDKGVGLAAVQVGVLQRIMVIDLQDDDEEGVNASLYPLFVVNPRIVERSSDIVIATEGCLSLPEQKVEVARSSSLRMKYRDYQNNELELFADNWLARVIQHEYDHLEGKLLLDYLSPIKKDVATRRLTKLKNSCL